ncbi:unnamed protein product [Vicia faba]|uniref:Uncharacterized protein n=1 Tax=Vicia faba TaxID=3906 RepID=A0AAV0ZZU5_VICFA|nr:unnamed protein product [Vicia faba]
MRNHVFYIAIFFLFSFAFLPRVHCAEGTFAPSFYTGEIYKELQNIAILLNKDIKSSLDFCIKDPKKDWEEAFDFTGRLDFVDSCVKKKGDFRDRICTAAEIRYYFHGFVAQGAATDNYVKPNKNCNLTSWVSGCEPGWGCSTGNNIDLRKDTKEIPNRTKNCKPCCEGFFCPQGLTCMIPCPLGSYCPVAKLNNETGLCDPYSYQIPQGETKHTCGSADIWTGVVNNSDIFCSPGSYCPTTTRKVSCDRGYYCRMGSTHQNPCSKFSQCNPNTTTQNMHAYGALLIVALSTVLIFIYNCSDQVLATRERRKAKIQRGSSKTGLQDQLVRTFSRRKSTKQGEQVNPATGNPVLPPMPPEQPSAATKEPSNLTKMMNSLENDPNSNEGFNLKIGDKNIKKQLPKGKNLHTQSHILRYAYGQIEKEKAQQDKNNLTFSGVISMAADGEEGRSRPEIEKLIGYVPQDDIVHGNLTVEENLRFSARCRLSDDLPKPDKGSDC